MVESLISEPIKPRERQMDGTDIPPLIITQRHIGDNSFILKQGLLKNRPASPAIERFYFATDTNQIFVYNNITKTWVGSTLT